MKRKITEFVVILTAIFIVYACHQHQGSVTRDKQDLTAVKAISDTSKIVPPDQLIVPGKSIGKISLNGSADSAVTLLGKPDFSDAAMGSVLITWYAKHDTAGYKTSIFANHNFGSKDEGVAHIRKILITTPSFKTIDGLNTGLPLSEYRKHFNLQQVSSYTNKGKNIKVYEAKGKGIAFEVDSLSNKGVAIIVHRPNDSQASYINMH